MLCRCIYVTHTSEHEDEGGAVVGGRDGSEDSGKDVSGHPEEISHSMGFTAKEIRTRVGLPLLKVL